MNNETIMSEQYFCNPAAILALPTKTMTYKNVNNSKM